MAGAFRQSWTGCRCPGVECYAGAASKHPEASDVKVTSKNHRGGAPSHHLVKTLAPRGKRGTAPPLLHPGSESWRKEFLCVIAFLRVMRGLDPRISSRVADGRVKPGHDQKREPGDDGIIIKLGPDFRLGDEWRWMRG